MERNLNINIISPIVELFRKQLSPEWNSKGIRFFFNSKEERLWDAVVVYENINEPYALRCRKGGLFFISGEPPIVKVYSPSFIDLFDHVISAHDLKHPDNHRDQQALPWYFGYDFQTKTSSYTYEQLEKMEVPDKTRKISFITSSRTFLPGHKKRLAWMGKIHELYGDRIDFYGKGICPVADKAKALAPYEFSICIENSYEYDYWTEKIADAILAYTVPIYCGCKNIDSYFPAEAMISLDIEDEQGSIELLRRVLDDSERIYQEKLPFLKEARNCLLFKYNLFPFVKSYIDKYVNLNSEEYRNVLIAPYDTYPRDWVQDVLLKTKRIVRKIF
ncbi:MAG: hypothetical protein PARBB_00638 [Parabacteroides distasonis]